jgi:hypothetical protein
MNCNIAIAKRSSALSASNCALTEAALRRELSVENQCPKKKSVTR